MAETETLSSEEVQDKVENLQIWGLVGDKLATNIEFDNYKEAAFFANSVFSIAEEEYHHPKVTVEYGSVAIDVTTHEAEGLTEKDFEVAKRIEDKLADIEWS